MKGLTVTALVFAAGVGAASTLQRSEPLLVRFVIDGDTLDVAQIGRVRLLGIDAPELGRGLDSDEPFAVEARDHLVGMVASRFVRLEYESGNGRDVYRRRLAYVFLEDGRFVNALMLRAGLARISARRSLARLGELRHAESEAKMSRRGMWLTAPSRSLERYVVPRRRPPLSP